MIDNADLYYNSERGYSDIGRKTSAWPGYVSASTDIFTIEQTAFNCIDIIDNHKILK